MKYFFTRILRPLSLILFFLAVIVNVVMMTWLPETIAVDILANIHRVNDVTMSMLPYFGVNLLVIFLSTFLLFFQLFNGAKKIDTEVVYVDRIIKNVDEDQIKVKVDQSQQNITHFMNKWEVLSQNSQTTLEEYLQAICSSVEAGQGILYARKGGEESTFFEMIASYAFTNVDENELCFEIGESLAGQVAKTKQATIIEQIPENYSTIRSGLGETLPKALVIFPVLNDDKELVGVLEVGAFKPFDSELVGEIENKLKTIAGFCQAVYAQ